MPVVLTSNDANVSGRYQWKDVTGVHYHYPNMYRNLIQTGTPFIYYRGVRRAQGPRQSAEYFGCGIVGQIWPDAETVDASPGRKAWYCSIEEYRPFIPVVAAKVNGQFFEQIPRNMWRAGVRQLPHNIYDKIIEASGAVINDRTAVENIAPILPTIDAVTIPDETTTVLLRKSPRRPSKGMSVGGYRRSRYAKLVGDRAEEIALKWIEWNVLGAKEVRWVARAGETPGWDIEFKDNDGNLTAVEVKGASGAAITEFELTANELEATKRFGTNHLIVLVADCLGK